MTRLQGAGISIELPSGWEGRIAARPRGTGRPAAADATTGDGVTHALVHVANFGLPTAVGDFGSRAVELMQAPDLLVILFEYDRASSGLPLFASPGIPVLSPNEFSPTRLQRVLPGQGGTQRFFNVAGRALCLYVVLGSHLRRFGTVPTINDLLRSTAISE